MTGGNGTLLPQSAALYVERKDQIPTDPFERSEILLIGDETKRHKSADSDAAGGLDEASSISEHTRFVSGFPGISKSQPLLFKEKLCEVHKRI